MSKRWGGKCSPVPAAEAPGRVLAAGDTFQLTVPCLFLGREMPAWDCISAARELGTRAYTVPEAASALPALWLTINSSLTGLGTQHILKNQWDSSIKLHILWYPAIP